MNTLTFEDILATDTRTANPRSAAATIPAPKKTISARELFDRMGVVPRQESPQPLALLLGQWYIFRNRPEVLEFLQEHRNILPLVLEAQIRIKEFFPRTPLALEVVHDPEEPRSAQLVISIMTDLDPDEALAQRDQLADHWWLTARRNTGRRLGISLEYR